HRLIIDDGRLSHAEAVELGAHRASIGSEHADLDIVASSDIAGKLERTGHAVEVVAGRAVEAELHGPHVRTLIADQAYGVAPADVRGVEQSAVSAVVDVKLVAAALL